MVVASPIIANAEVVRDGIQWVQLGALVPNRNPGPRISQTWPVRQLSCRVIWMDWVKQLMIIQVSCNEGRRGSSQGGAERELAHLCT